MALFVANEVGDLEDINNFTKYTAGAEMNVAVGLARLGYNSLYSTILGDDPLGSYIKKFLENENINMKYVFTSDEFFTGLMFKSKVTNGDPKVAYYRKNSACSHFNMQLANKIDLSEIDIFHSTGIMLAISESAREVVFALKNIALGMGKIISFDPNIRLSLWENKEKMVETINEFAKDCDYFLPGIGEGEILTGFKYPEDIADFYIDLGVKNVIVKLGASGGFYKKDTGESGFVSGFHVSNVVDTVGAGDGFATGIISGILDECNIEEMLKRACAIGAIQVMNKSDNEGLPTKEELELFMKRG